MVRHVLETVLSSKVSTTCVVTGHEGTLVEAAVNDLPVVLSHNPNYAQGLATSLTQAVSLLSDYEAVVVCLGDMPHIDTSIVNQMIGAFVDNPDKAFFVPSYRGRWGNPVLIGKALFDEVLQLQGDQGARRLAVKFPDCVCEVQTDCRGILVDYDTWEALNTLPGKQL